MSVFQKAERRKVKIKIAVTGPSGSGKTWSSLLIAQGLGKKIALIDTEAGSASLYSDKFDFDTVEIEAPYTVDKHIFAIREAVKAGYDVLVIDSLTHVWKGAGGLLEEKQRLDSRPGSNSFTNWASITKKHETFLAVVLQADIHLIATMRSKQDYILETNDKGKQAPKKVGFAPEQREGVEYEFGIVFDMQMDHSAQASKDRTGLFDDEIFRPSKETGERIAKWLQGATAESKPAVVQVAPPTKPQVAHERHGREEAKVTVTDQTGPCSEKQAKMIHAKAKAKNISDDKLKDLLIQVAGVRETSKVPWGVLDKVLNEIAAYKAH